MRCTLCHSREIVPVFALERVPVANNALCTSRAEALDFPLGCLQLCGCLHCGFVWNAAYEAGLVPYNTAYENNQSHSACFVDHLEHVMDSLLLPEFPVDILEVGCGQGDFLRELQKTRGVHVRRAVGCDPVLSGSCLCENILLLPGELNATMLPQDFIPTLGISRHVIEHVPEPELFLQNMLACAPTLTSLALETPSLEWIVTNRAYYDLYYEHCSLFDAYALRAMLHRNGFGKVTVNSLFGGQYLLAVASRQGEGGDGSAENSNTAFMHQRAKNFAAFRSGQDVFWRHWGKTVYNLSERCGKIGVWGAASKGMTFVQRLGDMGMAIHCVVDINPRKQGCYVPCVGTPVISPEQALIEGVNAFVVANPLYFNEVRSFCQSLGASPVLLPLESPCECW